MLLFNVLVKSSLELAAEARLHFNLQIQMHNCIYTIMTGKNSVELVTCFRKLDFVVFLSFTAALELGVYVHCTERASLLSAE